MNIQVKKLFIILVLITIFAMFGAQTTHLVKPTRKYNFCPAKAEKEICRADSAHGFDVQKYEITLAINDTTHYITGNVLATVNATAPLSSITYELSNLTVSNVKVNGINTTWNHNNGLLTIPINAATGQQFTTQIFYSGIPQLTNDVYHIGMVFSVNSVFTISDPDAGRNWWPCYDHPWDKAIVDLHITLRSDWKVAANGIRTSIINNEDGTSTTNWINQNPMTTYLVCLAAGPYVEIYDTDPNFNNLPLQYFVMPNQYYNALLDYINIPQMIHYFSELFGDYPFEKYGNVTVNMNTFGAMEHQTMITFTNSLITGTGASELTIAHELVHQWFGDAVSFLTFKDVWLSEGFATYSEFLWSDKLLGWQNACSYLESSFHHYYLNWENGEGPHTIYNPSFNNYFAPPSYEKAASVLHMLRLKLGETNFFNLIRQYFNAYCNGNAVTAEFQAMAEQISGQDLHQFFDQWIYGSGIPSVQYSVWQNQANQHLKILAKTTSPTATAFSVEIPFRFTQNGVSDSLLVVATPDGHINEYNYALDSENYTYDANFNNWTFLRAITEQKPVITECIPSNNSVFLSWQTFWESVDNQYSLFRKPSNAQNWTLLTTLNSPLLTYIDTTATSGISYDYRLRVTDHNGYSSIFSTSVSATPQAFSFANELLLVDETRDGNGSNINPSDEMVDTFYETAISGFTCEHTNWDCASQGLPDLATLGNYKLVLWYADDFNQNLLQDNLAPLSGYIAGGGKFVLSSWKTASVFTPEFLNRFAGEVSPVYDNSACLISAESEFYPTLTVDPNKTLSAWNGMLPYIYTFNNATEPIYTANMTAGSNGAGQCIALKHNFNGTFVMFGFPLYCMQWAEVSILLHQLLPSLNPALAVLDEAVASPTASLSALPNPFNPSTTISFYLPTGGNVKLELYNLKGQKVATLAQGIMPSGKHSVYYDGIDAKGRNLASGVYLLRFQYPTGILRKKINLLK